MTNEIHIWMGGYDNGRTPNVQQYDMGSREYICHLWEKPGKPYVMAAGTVVGAVFKWITVIGSPEYDTEILDASTVKVKVPSEAMKRTGLVEMQLVLHENGEMLHGPVISFMALRSLKKTDKETDEPVTLLVALVDQAGKAIYSIENMKVQAVEAETPSAKLETVNGAKLLTLGLVRGKPGEPGVGIARLYQSEWSSEDGAKNEFTFVTTDGREVKFTTHNGKKGSSGVSPVVTVDAIDGGHRVTIKDVNGSKSFDVMDGAEISDEQVAAAVEAYLKDNPIEGGVDEEQLQQAVEAALADAKASGEFDGKDGVSPTVNVITVTGGYMVSITDKSGTKTFTVMDGEDGNSVTVSSVKHSNIDGGSNVVTFSDGTTVTIKNGTKGSTGEPGYTPVKGKDYVDGENGIGISNIKITEV